MWGFVGLGNPGSEYAQTRHNIGSMVVAAFGMKHHMVCDREKFKSRYGKGRVGSQEVILVLPQTYMNLSGQPVQAWWQFYKWTGDEVVVVHDDLDLPLGRIKFGFGRGAAGHNGVKSIIESVGTQGFYRLRVGIGRPTGKKSAADYVLERFTDSEQAHRAVEGEVPSRNAGWRGGATLAPVIDRSCEALHCLLTQGAAPAMQLFHSE